MRGEEFFERGAHFGNVDGRDLPHDVQIHVRVIVCHDVAHAAHLAERQLGNGLPRGLAQVSGRVTAIARRDPPTPPDVPFSASGG